MNYRRIIALFAGEEVEDWEPPTSDYFPIGIRDEKLGKSILNPLLIAAVPPAKIKRGNEFWFDKYVKIDNWRQDNEYTYDHKGPGTYFGPSQDVFYIPDLNLTVWISSMKDINDKAEVDAIIEAIRSIDFGKERYGKFTI